MRPRSTGRSSTFHLSRGCAAAVGLHGYVASVRGARSHQIGGGGARATQRAGQLRASGVYRDLMTEQLDFASQQVPSGGPNSPRRCRRFVVFSRQ
jgi:hypothetical protein